MYLLGFCAHQDSLVGNFIFSFIIRSCRWEFVLVPYPDIVPFFEIINFLSLCGDLCIENFNHLCHLKTNVGISL